MAGLNIQSIYLRIITLTLILETLERWVGIRLEKSQLSTNDIYVKYLIGCQDLPKQSLTSQITIDQLVAHSE